LSLETQWRDPARLANEGQEKGSGSFLDSWDREKVSETVSRRVAITADTKGFGVSIAWFNKEGV